MSKIQKVPLLAAVLLFIFCYPYFIWNIWRIGNNSILFTGIISLVFLLNIDLKEKGRMALFMLMFSLLAFTAYLRGSNMIGFTATVMTCAIPFSNEIFARKSFDYFVTIYAIVIGISIVMYILALLGFAPSMGTLPPFNEVKDYNYSIYPLLAIGNEYSLSIPRFSGPFDEPGVVGTVSAIILTIKKFNLSDKRLLTIFITGFVSLSLFYYVIVTIYYVVHNILVVRNKRSSILILFVFAAFLIISYNISLLYDMIWSRIGWDSNSKLFAGDNRMGEAGIDFFTSIIGTKEFFWGVDDFDAFMEMTIGSASFISVIMRFGAVFSVLYIYLFASYAWRYKKERITYLLFLFVFIGSIYQRPFIFDPLYLYLFSMMAITCGDNNSFEAKVIHTKVIS